MLRAVLIIFAALVALEVAMLILGPLPAPLVPVAVVFNWLGLLILGIDETTERYGVWGERILHFLLSVPLLAAYAIFIASFIPERVRPGYCVNCGFDLKATPQRCPECGMTVTAANERV
jgi:hypothetical protein